MHATSLTEKLLRESGITSISLMTNGLLLCSRALLICIMQQTQQHAFPGYGFPGGFPAYAGYQGQGPAQGGGGSFSGHYGGGEGAVASAAIGPQGIHQTAGVYPENPNNPNINTRFAGTQGGPGFHSVSTQSFSSSANVDGRPSNYHQASTTVNDNGKVTTYTVRKP